MLFIRYMLTFAYCVCAGYTRQASRGPDKGTGQKSMILQLSFIWQEFLSAALGGSYFSLPPLYCGLHAWAWCFCVGIMNTSTYTAMITHHWKQNTSIIHVQVHWLESQLFARGSVMGPLSWFIKNTAVSLSVQPLVLPSNNVLCDVEQWSWWWNRAEETLGPGVHKRWLGN